MPSLRLGGGGHPEHLFTCSSDLPSASKPGGMKEPPRAPAARHRSLQAHERSLLLSPRIAAEQSDQGHRAQGKEPLGEIQPCTLPPPLHPSWDTFQGKPTRTCLPSPPQPRAPVLRWKLRPQEPYYHLYLDPGSIWSRVESNCTLMPCHKWPVHKVL